MSQADQEKYEKENVIPTFSKIMAKIGQTTGSENKIHYMIMNMELLFLAKNTLKKNPHFFKTVQDKVTELKSDAKATPELLAVLDRVQTLLTRLKDDVVKDPFIEAVHSKNIPFLLTKLNQVKTEAESKASIISAFLYGSEEMFDVLVQSGFQPQALSFIHSLRISFDKEQYKQRILTLFKNDEAKTKMFVKLFIKHIPMIYEPSTSQLNYALDALDSLIPYNKLYEALDFEDYPKNSRVLLDILLERNIPVNEFFQDFTPTAYWLHQHEPGLLTPYLMLIQPNVCLAYLDRFLIAPRLLQDYLRVMIQKGCHKSSHVLKQVMKKKDVASLKLLLETGDFGEMIEDVLDSAPNEEIRTLLKSYLKVAMWEGWNRTDVSKFDFLFSDEGVTNYTVCPVCLKFIKREDGCLYVSHDCAALEGFYHKRLYDMYAWSSDHPENNEEDENWNRDWGNNDEDDNENLAFVQRMRAQQPPPIMPQRGGKAKKITWCTDCGRICYGHQHYEINSANATTKPKKLPHGEPFDKDCRKSNHGGGYPEKVARYRRAREYALELLEDVGKITKRQALEDLAEQIWNAPLYKTRAVNRVILEKAWNIPTERFPLPKATSVATNIAPNIPRPAANVDLLPTFSESGENIIGMNDDVPVIFFRHRLPSGQVKDHRDDNEGIGLPTLLDYVANEMNKKFGMDLFGACPFQCGARLHPDEVEKAFELLGSPQPAVVAEYRAKFNQRFRG